MNANYPSLTPLHRSADKIVHFCGLLFALIAGTILISKTTSVETWGVVFGATVYVLCALASIVASGVYHFAPWHAHRKTLRRIDHAAIYLSITGVFTPMLIRAGTPLTFTLLVLCWGITGFAILKKMTDTEVKSKWSTVSYFGLAAVGLVGVFDVARLSGEAVTFIGLGACLYTIGVMFYVRKSLPFRYAIWHVFTNIAGICMFCAVWHALF